MLAPDPVQRMRAADACEKVTARGPELLQPLTRRQLGELQASTSRRCAGTWRR